MLELENFGLMNLILKNKQKLTAEFYRCYSFILVMVLQDALQLEWRNI